jgi:hypothetical protein
MSRVFMKIRYQIIDSKNKTWYYLSRSIKTMFIVMKNMKKQNKKNLRAFYASKIRKNILRFFFGAILCVYAYVFAVDILLVIGNQTATLG